MEKNCIKCRSPFGLLDSIFDTVFSDTLFNEAFYNFEKTFTNNLKECEKALEGTCKTLVGWKNTKDGNSYVLAIDNPTAEIAVEDEKRMLTYRYTNENGSYKRSISIPEDALIDTVRAKKGKEGNAVFVVVKKKVKEIEKLQGRQIEIQ